MDGVVTPVVRELSRLEATVRSRIDADNELVAGLLRLAPDHRAEALAMAEELPGDTGAAGEAAVR